MGTAPKFRKRRKLSFLFRLKNFHLVFMQSSQSKKHAACVKSLFCLLNLLLFLTFLLPTRFSSQYESQKISTKVSILHKIPLNIKVIQQYWIGFFSNRTCFVCLKSARNPNPRCNSSLNKICQKYVFEQRMISIKGRVSKLNNPISLY